jgi:hypothetical protein
MQAPEQNNSPLGQVHVPPWQVLPAVHAWQAVPFTPHAWSFVPAAQVLPSHVQAPPLQVLTPPWQICPAGQVTPQPPQFVGSLLALTQVLPYVSVPPLHFFDFFFSFFFRFSVVRS